VQRAIEQLHLSPVRFELGARPHPPRQLYRAYLEQSDVFVGIYWQRYGWIAPDETFSGLEDEYRFAGARPQLIHLKEPTQRGGPRAFRRVLARRRGCRSVRAARRLRAARPGERDGVASAAMHHRAMTTTATGPVPEAGSSR
jgi:hypothetical protein